jgi:CHAT domain-containing protein
VPAPVYADTARLLPAALDRAAELVHRHPRRAERLALWVERRAVLHGQQARARYVRAQVLTERGELDEALRLIADARALWTEDGDVLAALRTDLGRMHVLDDLGRHQEAIEVGERLVAALDGLCAAGAGRAGDDARYLRAHAVKNLGVAYGLVGRHATALAAYARAADEYAALGRHAETALPLANTGLELVALGRPGEALAAFERAIEIFEEIDDPVFAAQCRGDAAQAHRQLGQVGEALRLLEGARDSLERLGATTEAVRLRLALAQSHLGIGLWAEARDAASAAVDEAAHHGLRHDEARARFLVSLCDLAQDRCDAALEQLATAEALFLEVDDQQHLARVALACAEALARLGRREEARHTAAGCVTALERGGWVVPLVTARMLQSDLAVDRGEAQVRLAEVAGLVDGLDLPELSYEHQLRTARVLRARGDLDLAVHHLDRALAELERATGALPDYALLTSFRTHRSQAHGELVEVLLERGRPGDVEVASRVADDVRARTLADLLARAAGRGPVLSAAGRDLGEAFAELSEQYLAEERPAVGRPDTSRARTRELERRVNSLRTRHLDDDPATRAQRVRPDDQTILVPTIAYHVSSDDLIVFIHRRDGVVVRRLLGAVPRLHRFLDDLDDQWARAAIAATHGALGAARLVASSRATLRDLHELLVAPFSDTLADVGPRLCVVLDGRMGSVPFSLLHDGDGHLLERWTITLAPRMLPASASPLVVRPRARVAVVGVADTDAPAATAEADTVAASHRQAVLLEGPAATVQAVRESVAGAELVHVACHGLHQPDNPLFSRLRLHDRWMTSAEIVQLEISGALVVLSACQSGTHGRHREPVGLAWAFLAAGATGAVVAQWHVADATTAPVMASLHAGLAAGLPADEALRAAQCEAAAAGLHPFFWGAFALVSSPAPRAHGVVREAV